MGENYTLASFGFDPNAPIGASLVPTPYTSLAFSEPVKTNFAFNNLNIEDKIPYYLKAGSYVDTTSNDFSLSKIFNPDFMKTLNFGISSLSSLAGMYLGFKQLGLMKDQVGLAREQWNMTKQELNRIKNLRKKLTQSYMNS